MKDKNFIEEKVKEILGEGDLFLVEVKVSKNNNIQVFIDGDNGVKIQDCIDLSRQLEECLDRESEDFELSVLSFGLEEPLKMQRQYVKNIGRSGQESCILTLEELKNTKVDMFTTVFIGNSETKIIGGKMVTPRGYRNV